MTQENTPNDIVEDEILETEEIFQDEPQVEEVELETVSKADYDALQQKVLLFAAEVENTKKRSQAEITKARNYALESFAKDPPAPIQ